MRGRLLGLAAGAIVLAGCDLPFGYEAPDHVMTATAQRMSQLNSVKFDFQGTETFPIPPGLFNLFNPSPASAAANPTTFHIEAKGSGALKRPDRASITGFIKSNGVAVDIDFIVLGAKQYSKNPLTGQWALQNQGSNPFAPSPPPGKLDTDTYSQLLKYAASDQDLGDTTVGDTRVHHYRVRIDPAKVRQELERKGQLKDEPARKAFDDYLKNGKYTVEVWIGTSDHLLRRLVADIDTVTDFGGFGGLFGGASGFATSTGSARAGASPGPYQFSFPSPNAAFPRGVFPSPFVFPSPSPHPVHVSAHFQLDLHDFDGSFDIKAPI